ncbi:MAG: hypothetical protein PWP23_1010 [Candidatus Sumerlaeota bacterium]|nr:hypothetical protein [Candidatus Sumerlaeota bacterium]
MSEPLQETAPWRPGVAVGAGAFALYVLTAAREPQFGDGLEFVAAAAIGGVPHPPGYPLLMMLLWPFAEGPGAYFRCTLVCAVIAAVAAGLVTRLAMRSLLAFPDAKRPALVGRWLPVAAGAVAAFSASLWSSATGVEAYGLNAALLAGSLLLLTGDMAKPLEGKRLFAAGLLAGLGACNHLTSLCVAPLLAWRMVQTARTSGGTARWRGPALAVLGGVLGLLPLLYLPLRAAAEPAINWGGADSWEGLRWMLSGGDFKRGQFLQLRAGTPFTLGTWLAFAGQRVMLLVLGLGGEVLGGLGQLRGLAFAAAAVIGLLGWGAAAWGARLRWTQGKSAALALAAPAVLQLLFIFLYNIPDISDYLLGVWVALVPMLLPGAAAGLDALARTFGYGDAPEKSNRLLLAFAAPVVLAFLSNYGAANRAGNALCGAWIDRVVAALPENAVLLTHADYDTYSMWYAQQAEGRRRDVLVVAGNFLRYEWYGRMLPTPEEDPAGRVAHTEPGDVFTARFTARDHVAMLSRSAITPNLGRVPVVTTTVPDGWNDEMLGLLPRSFEMKPLAALLTPEEAEYMAVEYPVIAPPLLVEIVETLDPGVSLP